MRRRVLRAAMLLPMVLACAACGRAEHPDPLHRTAESQSDHEHAAAEEHAGRDMQAGTPDDTGSHVAGGHTGTRTPATRAALLHDEAAGTLVLELAPIPLPASSAAAHVMPVTPLLSVTVPFAASLTRFEVELLDGRGNAMPQHVLHHVNVMLPGRRDLFRPIMQRLVAAGEETEAIELPWPLGFPVQRGEQLLAYAMLHNDSDIDYGDVTLRLHFRYTSATGRLAVQPLFIDASPPPGPAGWDLPPGRSVRQWEGSPAVSGRILGLGGHLHRYGTELILEDVTRERVLFRTRPETDAAGNVVAMPQRRFLARLGLPVRSDRVYRITAIYDNPTGDTIRNGAMGSIGGVIRVRRNAWPDADTSDPLYREDRAILAGARDQPSHH